jgi:hypothetical protein
MAFVAAAAAFLSLSSLRRTLFFLVTWVTFWAVLIITYMSVYRPFLDLYPALVGSFILSALLGSLIVVSISTLVYGILKLLNEKIHAHSLRH